MCNGLEKSAVAHPQVLYVRAVKATCSQHVYINTLLFRVCWVFVRSMKERHVERTIYFIFLCGKCKNVGIFSSSLSDIHCCQNWYVLHNQQNTHETAICHTAHKSSGNDSHIVNTPSVKILCPQKYRFSLCFRKKYDVLKCCCLKDLSSSYVSCKTEHRWVKTNCCFVSDMIQNKAVVTTGKKNNSHIIKRTVTYSEQQ